MIRYGCDLESALQRVHELVGGQILGDCSGECQLADGGIADHELILEVAVHIGHYVAQRGLTIFEAAVAPGGGCFDVRDFHHRGSTVFLV